ncbi:MAG: dockerin type I domain-containing protein [Planctomycetota bacterium]
MNPKNDKTDFQTSEQFSKDLSSLFEPKQAVSPRVDRAVMDAAARRLRRRPNLRRWAYWAASAAAAMVVAGVLFMDFTKPADISAPVALRNDIDRDGAVNILDAFALARKIKSSDTANLQWDMNGDSVVDQKDVDTVAMAAVKMKEGVL